MMDIKIKIDAAALASQFKEIASVIEKDIKQGVANLATITHAKVVEMASTELKSTRKTFLDGLGFEEVADGVWVVGISENALFVEEGLEPNFDMKPGLLADGKTSKSGQKYRVVPLDHSKPPSQMTNAAQSIVSQIRDNLKKEKVPFKKIETNKDGSPKLGRLHSFSWPSNVPGKGNTPSLKGVSIYQTLTKTGNVRRDIMTFRTVTSGPSGEGKWLHPGLEGKKFLDRAAEWAEKEFYDKILPEILARYEK
jgi:hypothetical protein